MTMLPADEQRISEVERGLTCEAVVPAPPGAALEGGGTVLFALSQSRGGRPAAYVKGGDSVLVSLTAVTELGTTDPVTRQALVRLAWEPLGQGESPAAAPARAAKGRRLPGRS